MSLREIKNESKVRAAVAAHPRVSRLRASRILPRQCRPSSP
jgi:hypothetical protein